MKEDFKLGPYRIQPQRHVIIDGATQRKIEPKSMAVLVVLAQSFPEVATKQSIIDQVWTNQTVGDDVLNNAIWVLRRALGETAKAPSYIETVHRKGYRLLSPPVKSQNSIEPIAMPSSRWILPTIMFSLVILSSLFFYFFNSRNDSASSVHELVQLAEQNNNPMNQSSTHNSTMGDHDQLAAQLTKTGTLSSKEVNKLSNQVRTLVLHHGDWKSAERLLETARQRYPRNGQIFALSARMYFYLGRSQESQQALQQALTLDSNSNKTKMTQAHLSYFAQDYESAQRAALEVLRKNPNHKGAKALITRCKLEQGTDQTEQLLSSSKEYAQYQAERSYGLAKSGHTELARQYLNQAKTQQNSSYYSLAIAAVAINETTSAIELLQKSIDSKELDSLRMKTDPRLIALHSDASFQLLQDQLTY